MSKALVIKELRETAWIVILAAGAFAYSILRLVGYHPLMGSSDRVMNIPFVDGHFLSDFEEIAAVFAIVLALRQSAWESLRGTSVFLLWRPVSRDRILAVKMTVGLALLLGTSGLAFLAYALWAARPGTHASPFYWSMTIDSAVMWLAMTPIYLGSFLSGIRPGAAVRQPGLSADRGHRAVCDRFHRVSAPVSDRLYSRRRRLGPGGDPLRRSFTRLSLTNPERAMSRISPQTVAFPAGPGFSSRSRRPNRRSCSTTAPVLNGAVRDSSRRADRGEASRRHSIPIRTFLRIDRLGRFPLRCFTLSPKTGRCGSICGLARSRPCSKRPGWIASRLSREPETSRPERSRLWRPTSPFSKTRSPCAGQAR